MKIKLDAFSKIFISYSFGKGVKLSAMALYTILPVFLLSLIPSQSITSVLSITFLGLLTSSLFGLTNILRALKDSNTLNKHIVSKSSIWSIYLTPFIYFMALNLVFFSINMGIVVFAASPLKMSIYENISAETLITYTDTFNSIISKLDWATLYLGAFLTIFTAIAFAKLVATQVESKAKVISILITFFAGTLIFSGIFLRPASFLSLPFFKYVSYLNVFTYPLSILNLASIKATGVLPFLIGFETTTPLLIVGANFWNFNEPLAIINDTNGTLTYVSIFYHGIDKAFGLVVPIVASMIFLWFSRTYLLPFNKLANLNRFYPQDAQAKDSFYFKKSQEILDLQKDLLKTEGEL